jgi:hypothetical protein
MSDVSEPTPNTAAAGPLALLVVGVVAGAAPLQAVVRTPTTVRSGIDAGAVVGALMKNAPVTVTTCVPSCETRSGWAVLGTDGVVSLGALSFTDGGVAEFVPPTYRWAVARDRDAGLMVRARPRPDAPLMVEEPSSRTFAFLVDDEAHSSRGWLERPTGGFVSTSDVSFLFDRSTMRGETSPQLPLVFAFRGTTQSDLDRPDAAVEVVKYARFRLLGLTADGGVLVDGGVLPASAVRIAWPRPVPPGVPDAGFWVHVNPTEQTLTAWEGATPVFATLVSTGVGRPQRITRPGLHRVYLKALHDRMRGDEYFIEEVPLIQYFERGQGLHAASWHDTFGQAVSHGCVNLSTADARWLFDWSPPRLPGGWHTLWPGPKGVESLWVLVESLPRVLPDGGLREVEPARVSEIPWTLD